MVLAGFIGLFAFADQASAPPSSGLIDHGRGIGGDARGREPRQIGASGRGGSRALTGSAAEASPPTSTAQAPATQDSYMSHARQDYSARGHFRAGRQRWLRVDSGHRIEGEISLVEPSRHAAVACLVVASCPAPALPARRASRPEALLKKMTLDEKLGQLVQRAGGRSKALNSRLDDAELERVRAGQVGSYLHVAGAEPLGQAAEGGRRGIAAGHSAVVRHGRGPWLSHDLPGAARAGRDLGARERRNAPRAWRPKKPLPPGCTGPSRP